MVRCEGAETGRSRIAVWQLRQSKRTSPCSVLVGLHGDAAERAVARGWTRGHRAQACGETRRAFLIQLNAAASSRAASVFGLQPG